VPVIVLVGIDLAVIALYLFYLALLHATKGFATAIGNPFHHGILEAFPLAGLILDIENSITGWVNGEIASVSRTVDQLWQGTLASLIYLVDGVRTLGQAVEDAVRHLYDDALPAYARWAFKQALLVIGDVASPYPTVAAWIHGLDANLRAYVDRQVGNAASNAAADLTSATTTVYQDVLEATTTTLTSAETYADFQIDAAIAPIKGIAQELSAAEGAVAGELPSLPGLGYDDLARVFGGANLERLAGMLGAGAVAGYLVQALTREAGLTDAECRAKVKQICATDPNAWASLLEGLAVLGFAFSLRDLYEVAQPMVSELEPIIARAA
jgi:hypothetical protein